MRKNLSWRNSKNHYKKQSSQFQIQSQVKQQNTIFKSKIFTQKNSYILDLTSNINQVLSE